MAIHRRSNLPDPETTLQNAEPDDPRDGRSPDLQGLRLDVYRFIKQNPGVTRDQVAKALAIKSSSCTARIRELIDLGYVAEPAGMRKANSSGVRARCLFVTDRTEGGKPNGKVTVKVTLTIDSSGNYGATAKIVNGYPQSGKAKALRTKTCTFTLPPAQLAMDAIEAVEVGAVTRLDSQLNADQIIEGTYEILSS